MTKKRFNTNMEESKIIALKEAAAKEGIGANDLIERLLNEYLCSLHVPHAPRKEHRWPDCFSTPVH